MGSLFAWASSIPERARARELVAVLRVGYALSSGRAGLTLNSDRGSAERAQSAPDTALSTTTSSESSVKLESQDADAALDIFGAASVTGVPPP